MVAQLPQAADREPPDAGDLPRAAPSFDQLWQRRTSRCPVTVTSAVELDPATGQQIGDRIAEQTGRKVEPLRTVEPDILGGLVIRVGNSILTPRSAIARTTSQARSARASAALRSHFVQIKPDEITSILSPASRPRSRPGRPDRVGTV
jgi:hypothetical protein